MFAKIFSPLVDGASTLDSIVAEYPRAVQRRLTDRVGVEVIAKLERDHDISVATLRPADLWMPELGHLNTLLTPERGHYHSALAQYVLCLLPFAQECDLSLTTVPGDILYFKGFALTCGGRLTIRLRGVALTVESEKRSARFTRTDAGWVMELKYGACRVCHPQQNVLVVGGYNVDPQLIEPDDRPIDRESLNLAAERIFAGLELLATISEEYAMWCNRVLRQINVIGLADPTVRELKSRSNPARPGSIVLSHPASALLHAESCVHECTHLYFHLLALLTPILSDVTDTRLYYSSIVDRKRPLDRILFAYHATANILFFLERALQSSAPCGDAAFAQMKVHGPICEQLRETLAENAGALSRNAMAFWQESQDSVRALLSRYRLTSQVAR
jgi:HEXXH motif-containing protein